jgi:hypothetical protein
VKRRRVQCRQTKSCDAWFYCFDYYKCPNVKGEELERYTCQLAAEPMSPWGLPDADLAAKLQPSSYYAGYVKRLFALIARFCLSLSYVKRLFPLIARLCLSLSFLLQPGYLNACPLFIFSPTYGRGGTESDGEGPERRVMLWLAISNAWKGHQQGLARGSSKLELLGLRYSSRAVAIREFRETSEQKIIWLEEEVIIPETGVQ